MPTVIACAAAVLACAAGLVGFALWRQGRGEQQYARLLAGAEPSVDAATELRIKAFCGDCHAVPRPESFHRDAWHDEVQKGYEYYAKSGRTDLDPPPMGQVVAYYRGRAPAQITPSQPPEAASKYSVSFKVENFELDRSIKTSPATAGLCWTRLRGDASPVLVTADMISGLVTALDPGDPQRPVRRLAQLDNPCHIEPCDLDGDGNPDLLLADLGSIGARDHNHGRVVWLRQRGRSGEFEPVVLASGLGRVADARPIDTDSRGKPDVVVAEFGWHRTGRILLLRNLAERGQRPRFEPQELDPRTGTIHVPVCDLDGDGRPDVVALVSNENECVEAFLNQGNGRFHRHTLWRAPDLTFGSSGIQLADLNGDGKIDVLYANGDSFDNSYLSPWHGVQWLENRGNMQFAYHRLTDMAGATVACAGDFRGKGLPDIVAVSFLPRNVTPDTADVASLASIVLLEQVSPGRFVRHTLERGDHSHAVLVVGDFDGDGRPDFAVGHHAAFAPSGSPGRTWLSVWWNRGKP
jgi:hypothetical protein